MYRKQCRFLLVPSDLVFVLLLSLLPLLWTTTWAEETCSAYSGLEGGCGLTHEEYKYFVTLEGIKETSNVGMLIPDDPFETFNISSFKITSISYQKPPGAALEPLIAPVFFEPYEPTIRTDRTHAAGVGLQLLRFELLGNLSEYLLTASSSIIEFGYCLECADGSRVEGTLLLDVVDENNIAPEFRFGEYHYDGHEGPSLAKFFIDWEAYEENPLGFDYGISTGIIVFDGDYLPQHGRVNVSECLIDETYDCERLLKIRLDPQSKEQTGSSYSLNFELKRNFPEFLIEREQNSVNETDSTSHTLSMRLTVTDGLHYTSTELRFDFVGRAAPGDDGTGNPGANGGGLSLALTIGIASGAGFIVFLLILALVASIRRVVLQKRNIDRLTENDIRYFQDGTLSISGGSTSTTTIMGAGAGLGSFRNAPLFSKPYNNAYEIPRECLKIDETSILGRGNFCIVMKGYVTGPLPGMPSVDPYQRLPAAVKKVRADAGVYYRALLTELKIMSHIGRHPNIVSLLGACAQNIAKGELLVAVELCTNGNFRNYLKDRRSFYEDLVIDGRLVVRRSSMQSVLTMLSGGSRLSQLSNSSRASCAFQTITTLDLIRWAHQIANGMEFIASRGVIHGDLAARNVLLDEHRCAKIADFGLSVKLVDHNHNPSATAPNAQKAKTNACPLPWRYMAPEVLRDVRELRFSLQTDIWAFGVLLWEVFTLGQKPFFTKSWNEDFVLALENGERLESPKYAPVEVQQLMNDCWNNDPKRRPSFTEIKQRISVVLQSHADYAELLEEYVVGSGQSAKSLPLPRFMMPPGTPGAVTVDGYGVIRRGSALSSAAQSPTSPLAPRIEERPMNDAYLY